MKINPVNVVVGVGAGAIDEVLEWQDGENARTESFKTWTDWGRIALTLVGYAGQAMNIMTNITPVLAQSEVPLLTKSVGKYIRTRTGTTAASMVSSRRSKVSHRVRETQSPGFDKNRLQTY